MRQDHPEAVVEGEEEMPPRDHWGARVVAGVEESGRGRWSFRSAAAIWEERQDRSSFPVTAVTGRWVVGMLPRLRGRLGGCSWMASAHVDDDKAVWIVFESENSHVDGREIDRGDSSAYSGCPGCSIKYIFFLCRVPGKCSRVESKRDKARNYFEKGISPRRYGSRE